VVVRFPLPPLLVKGDDPVRVQRMPVPLGPTVPLAWVAVLGGFGSLGAATQSLIPPIRELSPRAATLLADLQSVDVAGLGSQDPGSAG
jgi:hypothetical protein